MTARTIIPTEGYRTVLDSLFESIDILQQKHGNVCRFPANISVTWCELFIEL